MPGFKYHQDYYYWYKLGCLYPDLATSYFAIDKSTKENGCLKIVPTTHELGRVEHNLYDGFSDSEVDPERQQLCIERFGEVYIELDIGDFVLFHANTFHGSNKNTSSSSRLALLGCYNTKRNNPIITNHPHPNFQVQGKIYDKICQSDIENQPDFTKNFNSDLG
jgi:ectoine hydroxylase-related dioxygenase (phytanoyl-CoA dioxygenase family)